MRKLKLLRIIICALICAIFICVGIGALVGCVTVAVVSLYYNALFSIERYMITVLLGMLFLVIGVLLYSYRYKHLSL